MKHCITIPKMGPVSEIISDGHLSKLSYETKTNFVILSSLENMSL